MPKPDLIRSAALVAVALLFPSGVDLRGAPAPANDASEECVASHSWITTPSLPTKDPASFCGFYQFAWQSFLYLAHPTAGVGSPMNFEDPNQFMRASGVFNATGQVTPWGHTPPNPPCYDEILKTNPRIHLVLPRVNKKNADGFGLLTDDQQAGSDGILRDQNGNIVYYEKLLNHAEYSFMTACELYKPSCQSAGGATHLTIPTPSVEVKTAWKVMLPGDLDPPVRYFTIRAVVEGQCSRPMTLGLVGFHVVSRTPGHPELIWATFEHIDNAPDFPCKDSSVPPGPFKHWSLFNPACATSKPPSGCTPTNTWPSPAPVVPPVSQICQNWPGGTSTLWTRQLIQGLNESVYKLLPAGAVSRNYKLVGTLWTEGGSLPPGSNNEVGSTFLANTSMESFVQTPNPPPSPNQPTNCFSCHSNASTPSNGPEWTISHLVFEGTSKLPCSYTTTAPPICIQTQN